MTRRHAPFLLADALAVAAPAAAPARSDGGGDNKAVVTNTRDGSSLFRFAFKVSRESGDVVDNQNSAIAYSRCEGCRTSAIAIQVVLVIGKPSTVTPVNQALAVNDQCTACATFASAYQIVRSFDGPMKFTPEGRKEVADIKRDVRSLRDEELAPADMQTRVADAAARLRTVVDTELVPAGAGEDDGVADESDRVQWQLAAADRPTKRQKAQKHIQSIRPSR